MRKPIFDVVEGDALAQLRTFPSDSVHCVVTSFPYWALRDYRGHPDQLGLEPTFQEFVDKCVAISREIRRVLRKDGTFWLNMGKSYAGTRSFQGKADDTDGVFARRAARLGSLSEGVDPKLAETYGRQFAYRAQRENEGGLRAAAESEGDDAFARRDRRHGGLGHGRDPAFKDQDLIMQGHLLAEALRKDGWWLRSDCVWWKNAMPESVFSRPSNTHENVFLLTKSASYFYDAEAVRTPTKDPGRTGHVFGGKDRAPDLAAGGVNGHTVRKTGNAYVASSSSSLRSVWADDAADKFLDALWVEFLEFAAERLSLMGDVWKISNEPFPERHFAVFSTKLVERCVRAGTSEKGCCPKCGAPWERTVTKGEPDLAHRAACGGVGPEGTYEGESTKAHEDDGVQDASAVKARILEGLRNRISTWAPGCACPEAADPIPCLVMDPFGGSGRSAKVAVALGRDALVIELVPEYAAMARANIADPNWEKAQRDRIRAERKAAKTQPAPLLPPAESDIARALSSGGSVQ